jgi:nucleoside-diphosphate-sugar epimerase
MRVMVVGATGTVGTAVSGVLEHGHEVVRASRRGDPRVDLDDRDSIAALADGLGGVDAVICCAASAPLTPLLDGDFMPSLQAKLLGQVELARTAIAHLPDEGSVTLTSGRIPEATPRGSRVDAQRTGARLGLPAA